MGTETIISHGQPELREHWNRIRERLDKPPPINYTYTIPKKEPRWKDNTRFRLVYDQPGKGPLKVPDNFWNRPQHFQLRYHLRETPYREQFWMRHSQDANPDWEAGPTSPRRKRKPKTVRIERLPLVTFDSMWSPISTESDDGVMTWKGSTMLEPPTKDHMVALPASTPAAASRRRSTRLERTSDSTIKQSGLRNTKRKDVTQGVKGSKVSKSKRT